MRISIAMGTFNGAVWLSRQLRSLAGQSRLPDELVVCDDHSGDDTLGVLEDFARTAPFSVRVEHQPENVGSTANFERAIRLAQGEIIATCDQDDVWYPDKLQRIHEAFERGSDLVFSDADVVDRELGPLGYTLWESTLFSRHVREQATRDGLFSVLLRFNVVTGTAMAFSSRWRDLLLPIPRGWIHDGWIALILSAAGRCSWIDEPLLAYRTHDRQQIGTARNTLGRQIHTARLMDEAYFSRLADNFEQCRALLAAAAVPVSGRVLELLQGKVDHCRARARMRARRRRRVGLVARELFHGRYAWAALGWKSIAQDLSGL